MRNESQELGGQQILCVVAGQNKDGKEKLITCVGSAICLCALCHVTKYTTPTVTSTQLRRALCTIWTECVYLKDIPVSYPKTKK